MQSASNVIDRVQLIDPRDIKNVAWATHLASKHRDELGAVHLGVVDACAKLGHVLLAEGGGQNVGMMVTKPGLASDRRIFPIIAAAVPSDLQRLHVGLGMLTALAARHFLAPETIIQAICRHDLPSNRFWAAAGFRPIAVRHSSSVRAKPCVIWRRRVDQGVNGVGSIMRTARPQGPGGRFLPADNPERENWFDTSAEGLAAALRASGALVTADVAATADSDPLAHIPRPVTAQLRLFDLPAAPSRLLRP